MYKHILVPTDGSALSLKAVKAAAGLAAKLGARVSALYVMAPYSPPAESEAIAFYPAYSARGYEDAMRKTSTRVLAKARAVVEARKVPFTALAEFHGAPWDAIIRAAAKRKCDLIVMASHGRRGLMGVLIGSETQKVLTHSKTPVLVCR